MTATVTIDGHQVTVTPAGRDALLWLRTVGGTAPVDQDAWASPPTRERLCITGLVDLHRDGGGAITYRLTPAGYEACAQLTRVDL